MAHAYSTVTLTICPTINRDVYQALTMQAHTHIQGVRHIGIPGATMTPEQIKAAVDEVADYAASWSPTARANEITSVLKNNGPEAIEAHYNRWRRLCDLAIALDPTIKTLGSDTRSSEARHVYAVRVAAALDAPRADPVQAKNDDALLAAVADWAGLNIAALRQDGAARAVYEAAMDGRS